jgi:hypothetical protein
LSLLVIPAVFTWIDDLGQWLLRLGRRIGQRDTPARTAAPKVGSA